MTIGGDPPSAFASPLLMSHLRKRGMAIQLLGVNSAEKLAVATRVGATAVLTDRPAWMASMRKDGATDGLAKVR